GVSADRLFWSPQGNAPWIGDIAELIVYTQPLTSFQRKAVEDYLTLKYAAYVGTAGAAECTPDGGTVRDSGAGDAVSPTPGAEIRYTTDASEPGPASPLYEAPLSLTATTTVRARAFRAGMDPSALAVATFTRSSDFSPRSVPGLGLWVASDAGIGGDSAGRGSVGRGPVGRGHEPAAGGGGGAAGGVAGAANEACGAALRRW